MKVPEIPSSQRYFGQVAYWISIISSILAFVVPFFILVAPQNNFLDPNMAFEALFNGKAPQEIWTHSVAGEFPGGHFYLQYLGMADSWAMLIIVFGSAFAVFGLIPTVICQVFKEKDLFCAILGSIIIALIVLSMAGMLSI